MSILEHWTVTSGSEAASHWDGADGARAMWGTPGRSFLGIGESSDLKRKENWSSFMAHRVKDLLMAWPKQNKKKKKERELWTQHGGAGHWIFGCAHPHVVSVSPHVM